MVNNRLGQVTMIVIVGLVLLIIVALSLLIFAPSDVEQTGRVDVQRVITFTESCINNVAEEGLYLLGQQGGYYQPPIGNPQQPWASEAFADSRMNVPYWYYGRECQNEHGCITFAPPALCRMGECVNSHQYAGAPTSMQEELEKYVNDKLSSCLNNYASLQEFDVIRRDNPQTTVIVSENDVRVQVAMPLTVANVQSGEQATLQNYQAVLDIDLENSYLLARNIIDLQHDTQFIENNLLHLITAFQGPPPYLPPFRDAQFLGSSETWQRTTVENTLRNEVLPFLSLMQLVDATAGYAPLINFDADPGYEEYMRGFYAYAEVLIGAEFPDHKVQFQYPHAPIYLNINDKEVLRGEALDVGPFGDFFGFLMTRYKFNYDIAFPLLTTVQDPTALGGKGYSLTFAFEGNIVRNFPLNSTRQVFTMRDDDSFIDFNAPQHHANGVHQVTVTDLHTGGPVEGALLSYECGYSHPVGVTDAAGFWSGTMPYCIGGELTVQAPPNYFVDGTSVTNTDAGVVTHSFSLWPYAEKEVVVYRRTEDHRTQFPNGCPDQTSCRAALADNHFALVNILGQTEEPTPHLGTFTFGEITVDPANLTQELNAPTLSPVVIEDNESEPRVVQLLPGVRYDIQAMLFDTNGVVIPREDISDNPLVSEEIGPTEFPNWISPLIRYQGTEGIVFTPAELYAPGPLVIYVHEEPLPTSHEDLQDRVDYRTMFPALSRPGIEP